MQFEQINFVSHYVFSRRSIHTTTQNISVEIVEHVEEENLISSMISRKVSSIHKQVDSELVRRPNRSSTLRLGDKDNFEFTLGAAKLSQGLG